MAASNKASTGGRKPTDKQILAIADRASRRIAPVWPLRSFVAVNPYLGLADMPFATAAERLAEVAGARLTMPRDYYAEAIADGRISSDDQKEAAGRAGLKPSEPGRIAGASEASAPPVLPTFADIASRVTGSDWAGFVADRVAGYAADYFDEGQASWAIPVREDGVFGAWRYRARVDYMPEIMGLRGFRQVVAGLPQDPNDVLVETARAAGLAGDDLELYFHRLAMTVGGWTAYARYKVWQAELYGGSDPSLIELLAVLAAWELVLYRLFGDRPGFDDAWKQSWADRATSAMDDRFAGDAMLQSALEAASQRALFDKLGNAQPAEKEPSRNAVQAAFCIDVRSEVFRRALETASDDIETIGFAGFFGFPIEYVPLGQLGGGAQCPVLLTPRVIVCEAVSGADEQEEESILSLRMLRRQATKAWKSFKLAAISSFVFVETMGLTFLGKLATDGLGLSRTVPHPSSDGMDGEIIDRLGPRIDPKTVGSRETGFDDKLRVDMAEAALTAMSLTHDFARLVVIVGHGSTTVNNPHAAGLDCGACGGHTGEANARVAAAIMNDAAVRSGLRKRGIDIPDDTVFLGALHDTTTDEVTVYDEDVVPASHADDVAALKHRFKQAGALARVERSALLHVDDDEPLDAQIIARSKDWAQVRPEWGLAGCSAFIVAPRSRTKGIDLGGRAFLHNYDWQEDKNFATLELIMTAPMIVASWISLQYYGSVVDNRIFGSGNKVLHNVVGTIGVLEGNGGDLRTGLAWQSLHDGERLIHEPLRLTAIIEAPQKAIDDVIAKHEGVRNLLDNGWLHLFRMGEDGTIAGRYAGNGKWEG